MVLFGASAAHRVKYLTIQFCERQVDRIVKVYRFWYRASRRWFTWGLSGERALQNEPEKPLPQVNLEATYHAAKL